MDLIALSDFLLVARHGGPTAAARNSSRSKATLSRQLVRLEESLGVRLVERGASQLRLTEEGLALQSRAEDLLTELRELEGVVRGTSREAEGRLRLSAPVLFSHLYIGELAAAFQARYPKVVLDVRAEDRMIGLVEEGIDAVIRVNPPPVNGLVGRCFLKDRQVVVGVPDLRQLHRARPDETLPAVVLSSQRDEVSWRLDGTEGRERISGKPVMSLPSYVMVRDAVVRGAGVAALPRSIVGRELASGELELLGDVEGGTTELWVLHTARRLPSPRVSAFVDFICGYSFGAS